MNSLLPWRILACPLILGIGAAIVCPPLFANVSVWLKYFPIDSMGTKDSTYKWVLDDLLGFPEFLI